MQWITYIVTAVSGSTTPVNALVTNPTALSVAGSTKDTTIATGVTTLAANPTGGYVGYMAGLATTTGTLYTTAVPVP